MVRFLKIRNIEKKINNMKRVIFLFFIINIFTYKTVTCQKPESEMNVGLFMNDSVLNIITNKIPAGWEIKNENNKLLFLKKDSQLLHLIFYQNI